MRYEWDEAKRAANLAKHGFDFSQADIVYEADFKLTEASPRASEHRRVDIAEVQDGAVLALVYTFRSDAVRVISLRPAKRSERKRYAEAKDRQLHQ